MFLLCCGGLLYVRNDKSSLMHAIERCSAQPLQPTMFPEIAPIGNTPSVLVVDAIAVLQSKEKIPAVQKLSHLQDAFIKCIQVIMVGYVEGQVIFDRYLDLFLKNKTSQERAVYLHRI